MSSSRFCLIFCEATNELNITPYKWRPSHFLGLFLHIEGQGSPMFGPGGTVIGTDLQQSLIPELMEYLKFAHMNQIFVFICLWNGAYVTPVINERLHGLIKDEVNLQSYILTALTPIVRD